MLPGHVSELRTLSEKYITHQVQKLSGGTMGAAKAKEWYTINNEPLLCSVSTHLVQ
jgi:hypothetical protein